MGLSPSSTAGEHVLLACWLVLCGLVYFYMSLVQATPLVRTSSPSPCRVEAAPHVALWPLRYLRAKVIIEQSSEWRTALLTLVDPDGFAVRASTVWDQTGGVLAPRTTLVEWKDVPPVGPGTYRLVLQVKTASTAGCLADDRVLVSDSSH